MDNIIPFPRKKEPSNEPLPKQLSPIEKLNARCLNVFNEAEKRNDYDVRMLMTHLYLRLIPQIDGKDYFDAMLREVTKAEQKYKLIIAEKLLV